VKVPFIAMVKDGWDHSSLKVMMKGTIHLRVLPMNGPIHRERGRGAGLRLALLRGLRGAASGARVPAPGH
jgi:hypothetical protein